jgi:murein DD-endopeptidase MepM/ murein hydrolase activator NlpD
VVPVEQYRKWEERVYRKTRRGLGRALTRTGDALGRFWALGRQNITVKLIPHTEKTIVNLRISVFALSFLGLVAGAVVCAVVWYATSFPATGRALAQKDTILESAQTNLDLVRESVAELETAARRFEGSLSSTMGAVGVNAVSKAPVAPGTDQGELREVGELKNLRTYLAASSGPLTEITDELASQKSLLADIPSLWPLQDVRGWITTPFGPAIHPFTGQWYLHKGIDIAQGYGTPIVATANGRVTTVGYEALGYGNYIDIKHKYGFSTKYGHLAKSYVARGQEVVRGQVIAAMGATGLATGPHLHYEIRIGDEVVDPTKYLSFSTTLLDQ